MLLAVDPAMLAPALREWWLRGRTKCLTEASYVPAVWL
jgi:hypothetical protein